MRDVLTFGLVAFSAIFFVVDPIAVLPIFLAMTANESQAQKRGTALRAAITSGITLTVFARPARSSSASSASRSAPSRSPAASCLFLVALDMMQARQSRTQLDARGGARGHREGGRRDHSAGDSASVGPGLDRDGDGADVAPHGFVYTIPVFISIFLTAIITWLMLRGAGWIERRLSKTFMNVVMRIMGLILAAISVEFVIAGIKDVLPTLHK